MPVSCPHCAVTATAEQSRRTILGYRAFRCCTCRRSFNERTGTPYNHLRYPTDVVLLVALWRLRYRLSLRDLAEMFLERGVVFSHEAVREWEGRFAPFLADWLRVKRHGMAGPRWHTDETYIRGMRLGMGRRSSPGGAAGGANGALPAIRRRPVRS